MDYNEFAETVKAKHPEYADRDNKTLAEAMLKKFPEYADRVKMDAPLQADEKGNAPVLKNGLAAGTSQQQIDFERGGFNKFSTEPVEQRILNNVNTVGVGAATADLGIGLAKGALSLGGKALPKLGETLEAIGAKGQNFAAKLRPQTIEAMTKAGQNPGEVGKQIGSRLAQEEIIGATPKETFDNLMKAKDAAGKDVGEALKNINKGDTTIEAKTALDPLLKATEERLSAMTSARKAMGRPFKQVYEHLSKVAEENSGRIGLDDVRSAMKEIGPMVHKGSEEVQAAMSELYGTLANVQDHIVTQIANTAKNPALKEALMKANEKFSLYSRLTPDLERAAAKEAVGKGSLLSNPVEAAKHFVATKVSGGLARTGKLLKGEREFSGFPLVDKNKMTLQRTLDKLKRVGVAGNINAK